MASRHIQSSPTRTGFSIRFDHLSLDPSNYDLLDLDTKRNSGSCNQGWARLVNHRREVALCARERQSDKRRILVNIHGCLPWIIWQMYHYKGNICTIYKDLFSGFNSIIQALPPTYGPVLYLHSLSMRGSAAIRLSKWGAVLISRCSLTQRSLDLVS